MITKTDEGGLVDKATVEARTSLDCVDAEYLKEFVGFLHAVAATGQDLVYT